MCPYHEENTTEAIVSYPELTYHSGKSGKTKSSEKYSWAPNMYISHNGKVYEMPEVSMLKTSSAVFCIPLIVPKVTANSERQNAVTGMILLLKLLGNRFPVTLRSMA